MLSIAGGLIIVIKGFGYCVSGFIAIRGLRVLRSRGLKVASRVCFGPFLALERLMLFRLYGP